jgi:hypothetical protein
MYRNMYESPTKPCFLGVFNIRGKGLYIYIYVHILIYIDILDRKNKHNVSAPLAL